MNVTGNSSASSVSVLDTDAYDAWDDATWILTASFIIFTMQSGFGLLEAGNVSQKNEVNIMVKNAVDVVFGGITYWMFGYGLSFGETSWSNPFIGWGSFCVDSADLLSGQAGHIYSTFVFQLSFATTATTIVSGAMAERTHLVSYMVFSLFNTIVYCIPAHWVWASNGFLYKLGAVDFAGSGPVHLLGASSALVAALMLGPRQGRFDQGYDAPPAGNPTNCMVGMFMLWWGWLGFNCGSTFGISGGKWVLAAKSAVTTLNASMSGGFVGIVFTYIFRKKKIIISDLVNSILGSLVAITASCPVVRAWEACIIGAVGGLICAGSAPIIDRMKIDDPVGAIAVHGIGGMWGVLAVGIFANVDPVQDLTSGRAGLLHGGGFYLLGVQTLMCVCIIAWSSTISFIMLYTIDRAMGLRLTADEEMLGSDLVEHDIGDLEQMTSLLRSGASPPRRTGSAFGFRREMSQIYPEFSPKLHKRHTNQASTSVGISVLTLPSAAEV